MFKKYTLLQFSPILFLTAAMLLYMNNNKNKLENAFKQTLVDIQQNSINNFEWKEADWQHYQHNQLKRLPIFTQKYFYDCV